MNAAAFAEIALDSRRVAVCVGCGGVGKTTVAATLALEAARRGRRALVLTIDPARRLADALGIAELGNVPQEIPRDLLDRLGVPANGSLSAMMLDMKRTFDDLVERFAESPEARDRILGNPIYKHVSDALAGSVEYSAMEKVYELCERVEYDLVVVDTPPAEHALDFLEAPQRLLEFLDSRLVQILIHPAFTAGRFGVRLFQRGTTRVLKLIERVSGMGFLEDLSEFLLAFEAMSEGFKERAQRVRGLLVGPDASFVLVAGPSGQSVRQAAEFLARLESFEVPLTGVVVNRVRQWPGGGAPPDLSHEATRAGRAALAGALAAAQGGAGEIAADDAARAALETAERYAAYVRADADAIAGLRERTSARQRFWCEVPEFSDDVHDLDGLARMGRIVFGARGDVAAAGGRPDRGAEESGAHVA